MTRYIKRNGWTRDAAGGWTREGSTDRIVRERVIVTGLALPGRMEWRWALYSDGKMHAHYRTLDAAMQASTDWTGAPFLGPRTD